MDFYSAKIRELRVEIHIETSSPGGETTVESSLDGDPLSCKLDNECPINPGSNLSNLEVL